jgi:hypothetical protein
MDAMFPDFNEIIKQMFKDDVKQKAGIKLANGMTCARCNLLNEYVTEPNQDDGTYICYNCRKF